MTYLDQLDVFYGQTTSASAHIYARLPSVEGKSGLTLAGDVHGPECRYSTTLPATVPLCDMGPGKSLLARAIVPDPCFWSPRLPALYRVTVQLIKGGEVVETAERRLGLRLLGARGQSLFLEGQRWVLRGVLRDEVPPAELSSWRETSTAMVARDPDDDLCGDAARRGVLLVACVTGSGDQICSTLRRLARSAAVAVAVLDGRPPVEENMLQAAANIILAQRFDRESPVEPAPWAQVVVVEVDGPERLPGLIAGCALPVFALRPGGPFDGVIQARAAGDRLQRDLVPCGNLAGYIV